jgi:cytochrome c553
MKGFLQFLAWAALVVAGLIVAGAIFVYAGFYNVAATTGHSRPVEQILRTAMMRSVVSRARHVTPPPNFNPQDRQVAEQAVGHYEMMCRTCHGAPGKKPDPWQLYPPAPDLTDALKVMRWSDAEVFWITKNGIKDTGMSAFGGSHSDEDLWALTALIRQLGDISPEQYQALSERAAERRQKEAHQPPGRPDPPSAPDQPKPEPAQPEPHKH